MSFDWTSVDLTTSTATLSHAHRLLAEATQLRLNIGVQVDGNTRVEKCRFLCSPISSASQIRGITAKCRSIAAQNVGCAVTSQLGRTYAKAPETSGKFSTLPRFVGELAAKQH